MVDQRKFDVLAAARFHLSLRLDVVDAVVITLGALPPYLLGLGFEFSRFESSRLAEIKGLTILQCYFSARLFPQNILFEPINVHSFLRHCRSFL
jgi:hypothetical protein